MKLQNNSILLLFVFVFISCKNQYDVIDEIANENTISLTFERTISAEEDQKRLALDIPWSDFEPTGLYAIPKSTLKLNVEGNNMPVLLIGTYSRLKEAENPIEVPLKKGENIINVDKYGGLMYVRYVSDEPFTPEKIKIDFESGFQKVPFFVKGKTSTEDWKKQLQQHKTSPDVVLVSDRTIQVYSLSDALAWQNQDISNTIGNIDQIIDIENTISGLSKTSNGPHAAMKHKLLMTQSTVDLYMFATNHRTAFTSPDHEFAFTNKNISENAWGPWHEIGHMHQQSAWTWGQVEEVTVNVYSLAVERSLGFKPSRIKRDDSWTKMTKFVNGSSSSKNYNDNNQIDLITRLCLFEQLRMAFGDEFYKELHKQTRTEQPTLETDKEKMEYFMVKASKISGRNLTTFFKKWGFVGVNNGYAAIDNLNLPAPMSDLTLLKE